MTAAQDYSRADFERELIANRQFKPSDFCFINGDYTGNDDVQFAWDVWQAARALPAGMEPVAVASMPFCKLEWLIGETVSAAEVAKISRQGAKLYTAAQVHAMLDAGIPGNKLPPGWRVTEDMHIAAVKVLHRATGVDGLPQRMVDAMLEAAPQPPAAPATTEPQAPTTGAGSVTAGAAPAYRLLQPGVDTIQATDEVLADDVVTWKAVGRGIFAGMTYIGAMLPVRRALKTGP